MISFNENTPSIYQGVYLLISLDENTASVSQGVYLLISLDENTASVSQGLHHFQQKNEHRWLGKKDLFEYNTLLESLFT